MVAMRLMILLFIASPAIAAHSGVAHPRTAPEPSDIALFMMAAAGVWFVRRAMRVRLAKRGRTPPKD